MITVAKRLIQEVDPSWLKDQQHDAFEMFKAFMLNDHARVMSISGDAGVGKLQPNYSKVLTPKGWSTMGEIEVGDEVSCPVTGDPVKVLKTFPQQGLKIYRVTFSDGTFTDCCNDHLWKVATTKSLSRDNWKVIPLQEIIDTGVKNKPSGNKKPSNRYSVPLTAAIKFPKKEVPLDPYLLGVLLGDGYLPFKSECTLTTHEDKYEEFFNLIKDLGQGVFTVKKRKQAVGTKARRLGFSSGIKPILESLSLLGKKSGDKFIPDLYLTNDISTRKSILSGLLDTDGSIAILPTKKKLFYSTTSPMLRDGIMELIRGLGGSCTYSTDTRDKYNGKQCYKVSFRVPFNPYTLERNKEAFDSRGETMKYVKKITGVDFLEVMDGKCLLLDSDDHLYLTDGYTVTHNTFLLQTISEYFLNKYPNSQIMATAPTHKAVKVIRNNIEFVSNRMHYATSHSYCCLRPKYDKNGYMYFTPIRDKEAAPVSLLLVDECSMVSEDLYKFIIDSPAVKIIFIGDKNQLPPINERMSKTFSENTWRSHLTEVIRQKAGSPILKWSRDILNGDYKSPTPDGESIIKLNGSNLIDTWIEYFCSEEFDADNDYARVLAWTNSTVDKCSKIIRKKKYGDDIERIHVGEYLYAKAPVPHPDIPDTNLLNNNDEFVVTDYKVDWDYLSEDIKFKVYDTWVEHTDLFGRVHSHNIKVIHEESEKPLREFLKVMADFAKAQDGRDRIEAWQNFYEVKNRYAEVGYTYALTVHRSQGSTIENVFYAEADIRRALSKGDGKELMYTAITRAKNKIFLI